MIINKIKSILLDKLILKVEEFSINVDSINFYLYQHLTLFNRFNGIMIKKSLFNGSVEVYKNDKIISKHTLKYIRLIDLIMINKYYDLIDYEIKLTEFGGTNRHRRISSMNSDFIVNCDGTVRSITKRGNSDDTNIWSYDDSLILSLDKFGLVTLHEADGYLLEEISHLLDLSIAVDEVNVVS